MGTSGQWRLTTSDVASSSSRLSALRHPALASSSADFVGAQTRTSMPSALTSGTTFRAMLPKNTRPQVCLTGLRISRPNLGFQLPARTSRFDMVTWRMRSSMSATA